MGEFEIRRQEMAAPIEVVIPAEVAFDIDELFKVQRAVFERMGHPSCNSGADLRLTLARRFMVDGGGNLKNFGE